MTSTRPRRGANAHVARLGAEGAAQLARRQHCQSDGCIYNEDRVVPECFLWATNDMDAAIYCIFDRLAKEINEAARRARYRNLDDEGKRQRLRAAGEDLMDRWGRVVDMFVLRGHHLPDLRRYASDWLQQYVAALVVAGTTSSPSMPPPPAQGWDSIMIPQPGTPTSRLWSEDQSTANGTMPAVQRPSDARHSASVDSETDGIHTVDSKSREERKGRSQHITTIPDASSRRRGPNTDRSGTANDRRLHSNDHPVSQETIGKRLKFLQKHRDHQSDLFIKYTDSLEHFSMKQQSPVKAVAELEAKAEAAGEELDLYDQWIKELKGGIVGASTSRPANSRSEVGGLATTSNQRVPTTPTTTVNGTPANTKVHALGLPDDDDADLEEMDCA